MVALLISFFSGFIISLSGGIAPSNMSAVAMEITIDSNKRTGLWFGVGAALVEMIYIRLYFFGFDALVKNTTVFSILQWTMIILFLMIGIYILRDTYRTKNRRQRKRRDFTAYNGAKSFALGMFLKAINPMQFAFWTFWSTYLIANNWLRAEPAHYNIFCLGLALATFTGYALYVYLGDYLENKSFFSKMGFRRIIAVFLILTSIAWGLQLIFKPEGLVF